jgi:hypothetical protein
MRKVRTFSGGGLYTAGSVLSHSPIPIAVVTPPACAPLNRAAVSATPLGLTTNAIGKAKLICTLAPHDCGSGVIFHRFPEVGHLGIVETDAA